MIRGAQGNIKAKPPLAEIFQGQMRSCLQPVNGEPTATLQPFFSLQLDIQSGDVKSVTEALVNNFATEMIDGYVCPKTKQAVEASKRYDKYIFVTTPHTCSTTSFISLA